MSKRGILRAATCLAFPLALATVAAGCSGKKTTFFGGSSQTAAAPIVEDGFVPVGAAAATQNTSGTLQLPFSTSLLPTGTTSANIVVLFLPKGGATIVQLTPASVDNSQDVVTVNVTAAGTYQPEVQIHADQTRSSVIASGGGHVADGKTPLTITVFAKDADGLPVGGDTVTLAATGAPSGVTITQPGTTDATGAASGSVTSTFAGPITITATITGNGGPTVTLTTVVTFVPGALDLTVSKVSAGFNTNLANGFSAIPINVTTTDAFGNPIAGLTVTIAATGSFMTINQPSAPTDSLGKTSGSVASSFPQGSTVTATVQGSNAVQLSNQAQITFVLVPHYMIVAQNQSGSASPSGAPGPVFSPSAVAVFKVNPTTGSLTAIAPATQTDQNPNGVAIEPRQRFVYVGCEGGVNANNDNVGTIAAFRLNDANGALTPVAGSPFALPHPNPAQSPYPLRPNLRDLAITPNGQFLYVIDPTNPNNGFQAGVYGFTIDASTGALHFIQRAIPLYGQQVDANNGRAGVNSMAIDPAGRFLYVVSATQGSAITPSSSPSPDPLTAPTITRFSIDPRLGLLTEVGTPVTTGINSPVGFLAMDPLGRFLYGSDESANDFYMFAIDPVSGELTQQDEKDNGSLGDNLGNGPLKAAPDPFGRRVYVPCSDGTLSAYNLGFGVPTDSLVPLAAYGDASGNGSEALLALPGGLVYQTDASSSVNLFTLDNTGAAIDPLLTPATNLANPTAMAVSYGTAALP